MKKRGKSKSRCCGCGGCMAACPFGAITMITDREGFAYPRVDPKKCRNCGRCEAVCPMGKHGETQKERLYLGVQAKSDEIRFSSSSGGFFPVLAGYVLRKGGVVFGAAMERDGSVVHRGIQTGDALSSLQKTKYVQSDISGCFSEAERYLDQGRLVLFTGTPCQCQSVRTYLGGGRENLLLADLVCYGTPSPEIWKKYVRELEKRYEGEFSEFRFRDKRHRDNGHTVSVRLGDREYAWPMDRDPFCRVYFRNYMIRPSCHECEFCTVERDSDITMGDFWGIEKVKPQMDDGMGTSLVILHSKKAQEVWNQIRGEFRFFPCLREEILQPRLCGPTVRADQRESFLLLGRFLPIRLAERLAGRWKKT
ncbi:MAG: 4Fe-4S dicluster domain-containing protein [Lachnospiraceae bacterium]|nr:4Fe-4S dicluster domain-containing protein [Lachnospiraceae bacterium]